MKKNKKVKISIAVIWILSILLAGGSVPASIFLFDIPKYVTIVLSVLVALSGIVCYKVATKRGKKIAVVVVSLFTMVFAVLGNYCNPYWNSIAGKMSKSGYSKPMEEVLSRQEAIEDLEYAMYYLDKCHPLFYHEMPKDVEVRYQEVLAELESINTMSVCELSRKIEYVFSVLHDGHSYVKGNPEIRHYMKDIYKFKEKNAELIAVGGIEMEELLQRTKDMYSYEEKSWHMHMLQNDLSSLQGLMYLGFNTDEGVEYTYENPDGTRESEIYFTDDFLTYDEYMVYNHVEQEENEADSFVYYEIDEEKSLALLTINSCDYNSEYKDCLNEMFTQIKEKGIEHVAVDLRKNGGGSSLVANEFIRYLNVDSFEQGTNKWRWGWFVIPFNGSTVKNKKYENLLFEGNVYVLTASESFSSAMLFAQWILDNDLGTLIGEAPGNTPNGYGDITMFTLPNSELFMQLSTKEFIRADKENPSDLVDPDIVCDSDEAIEVLYEQISK